MDYFREKTRTSGWPDWINNDSDKEKYLKELKQKMNIDIKSDEIEDNPALRLVD